ncbi:hypothetical protein GT755_07280 [Herbidospora sp. NEAU-GS84]|uniref:Uncharacterized protein n=1 Tax=Herbidospora solisilvae TaxID=2696284 RepID=A0A7C9J163_9ACTN|nr:hypothetical protein [Herbidospora solisilvae]NAS21487.1 hypothetical protein [Herbidospora solisilvae]
MSASETSVRRNYSLGARRAAVSIVAAWHLGFDLVGTVGTWESYRFPWLAGLAWVLYAAIGVVAGVALLRERPLGAGVWPLAVVTLVVSAMVMAACEPGDVVNAADWGWGSVGWLAMILFWPRPTWLRDLSGFLLANVVVTLAGLASAGALDARSLSKFLVVSVGAILLQAGASAGGHALDLAARWAVENSNRTAGAEAARKAADQVHADRLARYAEVRAAVAPVLTLLAEGADPADPDVRHESAVGAARLRRLIAETDDAPDPLLHTLRACAFDVERRGVVVLFLTAGTVPPLPLEVRRALVEAPIEGMARARSQARVTLVATPREVIVSVLTDAPSLPSADGSRAANVATRVEAENGGTQLWIESRWTAP